MLDISGWRPHSPLPPPSHCWDELGASLYSCPQQETRDMLTFFIYLFILLCFICLLLFLFHYFD
jgi:hypothetical protein